ncbi:MAG TPA: hypothetical protein VKP67_11710 [Xanthobacteraceae bacterium]|nr:hypothetical protein [Xanthobacteraceae bacterium]
MNLNPWIELEKRMEELEIAIDVAKTVHAAHEIEDGADDRYFAHQAAIMLLLDELERRVLDARVAYEDAFDMAWSNACQPDQSADAHGWTAPLC